MERRQHPFHFPQTFLKFPSLVGVEDVKCTRAFQLTVHLVSGRPRDLQISRELALAPLSGTFGDVVSYCVDRSDKLGTEAWRAAPDGAPERRAVARDRELVGLLPDLDSSKGVHAGNMG